MKNALCKAAVLAVIGSAIALACTIGGKEGDACNPLVERDECQGDLRCTQTSCTSYSCCPPDHPSSNAKCTGIQSCLDASDEAGDADAATD